MDKGEALAIVALKKSGAVDVSAAIAAKTAAQAAATQAVSSAETAAAAAEELSEAAESIAELETDVSALKSHITSKDEEDADYHLGFYIDENGDLCQVDEEE